VQADIAEGAIDAGVQLPQPIPQVRRARRDEIGDIVDLIGRAHAETYAPSPVEGARYLADMRAKADRRHRFWRTYLVAEIDGRIVGVVQTVFNTVNALYVEADRRGRGIGSQLLSAAEAALRDKGVNTMRVRVAKGFPRIVAFYERQGWRVSGAAESYESDPEWGLRLLEMQKPLGPADDARRTVNLMIVKAVLCAAAVAIILLSVALTHAIGMTKGASFAVGAMLAMFAGRFVLGLRSPHFGIRRTLILGAAGTGIYLVVPLAAIALGWLGLQAAGLQEEAARDRTMTSILVLCALAILADRPARYAVARVWEHYV
jgi:GNAT superfamily N-acetyltransferase